MSGSLEGGISNQSSHLTKESFDSFLESLEFRALEHYRPPFSPLRTLGIEHRELSHSAFLRFMLDPTESHGLGNRFLCGFLEQVAPAAANEVSHIDPKSIAVRVEYERIDVFIDCSAGGPVVGVEVKVWAGEGWEQIKRYQQLMSDLYPKRHGIFVFLTPDGRKPETDCADSPIRCVPLSWLDIAAILHQESRHCRDAGIAAFMIQFGRHLRDMVNGDSEERRLVSKLFKESRKGRVAQRIAQVRQQLFSQNVVRALERRVAGSLENKPVQVKATNFSNTKNKEVWIQTASREGQELPFVFLFYDFPDEPELRTGMHLLLTRRPIDEEGYAYIDALKATCPDADVSNTLIPLPGWGGSWHLGLPSSAYRDGPKHGWRFEDESFDEEWVEMAAKQFVDAYKLVKPAVEHYLTEDV